MATRIIVPEEPVRPATVGIAQQMQLEFAAGVTDLDDKPAVILVCVRIGHGLLPAHPMLGKEHEQFRLRQLVSKAAIAPEHRCNNAIAEQRLQLCAGRAMSGCSANPGSSVNSPVFLPLTGAPFCLASPRRFALDREAEDATAPHFVGRLSRSVNV